jgi:hypothetical protein
MNRVRHPITAAALLLALGLHAAVLLADRLSEQRSTRVILIARGGEQ